MSMLMLAIGGLLFGALLGQRFKVLILLPASAFVVLAVGALTLARDDNALLAVVVVALVRALFFFAPFDVDSALGFIHQVNHVRAVY